MTGKSITGLLAVTFFFVFTAGAIAQENDGEYLYIVPYVPSDQTRVERMLRIAGTREDDIVYDLGCGDGRIVITAAKEFGASAVGVEINAGLIGKSERNAAKEGVADKVRFIQQDLFAADIGAATVVTLYLTELVNRKLRPKLFMELKPGTRIVSSNFDMGEWKPDKPDIPGYDIRNRIFLWIIPANVSGIWELNLSGSAEETPSTLNLEQKYQEVHGELARDTQTVPLKTVTIKGDSLHFTVEKEIDGQNRTTTFEGIVRGDVIEGTAVSKTDAETLKHEWSAARDSSTRAKIYDTAIKKY
ncbi:SAM-dependent methyltransferase [Candidatus Latescibacterota bacterium]